MPRNNRLAIVTLEPHGAKTACFHQGVCRCSSDRGAGESIIRVEQFAARISERTGAPIERIHHTSMAAENWDDIGAEIGLDQITTPAPHVALVRQFGPQVQDGPIEVALFINGGYVASAEPGARGQAELLESVAIGARRVLYAVAATIDLPAIDPSGDLAADNPNWSEIERSLKLWGALPGGEPIQPPRPVTGICLNRPEWANRDDLRASLEAGGIMTWHAPREPLGECSDFVTFVDPSMTGEGSDQGALPDDVWDEIVAASRQVSQQSSESSREHYAVWVTFVESDTEMRPAPAVVMDRPDWARRTDLAEALKGGRVMTWANVGESLGEYSDFVAMVDASCTGEGPDQSDLPSDIWDELVEACKKVHGPLVPGATHYPVRITFSEFGLREPPEL